MDSSLPSTRQRMGETTVFRRNDDDVVLLVRAHFTEDVRDDYFMLLAVLISL